jgi:hypothetical protein
MVSHFYAMVPHFYVEAFMFNKALVLVKGFTHYEYCKANMLHFIGVCALIFYEWSCKRTG